jgi:hypothetical protein
MEAVMGRQAWEAMARQRGNILRAAVVSREAIIAGPNETLAKAPQVPGDALA